MDWLASEFVTKKFSMKAMTRLMVTSEAYKRSSEAPEAITIANSKIDPGNAYLWHFNLQRLEAEPIWDEIPSTFLLGGALSTQTHKAAADEALRRPIPRPTGVESTW